jgi:tetratricopeptide (TPR) repeat protein
MAALCVMATVLCVAASTAMAGGPTEFVRDYLERYALIDLRLQDAPTLVDYQIVSSSLDIATDLTPNDVELWRRLAEAQFSAGQVGRINETSERVVALDPGDTVAMIRMINASIGRQQTARERLETYARFLSPAGDGIDAAVRSRLAFDAALLARELGDESRVDRLLDRSLELDRSHKTALAFTMSRRTGPETSPEVQLAWLIRLLYADPLDPITHRRIAELLVRQGANEQAYRFFASMRSIEDATRIPPNRPRELFKSEFFWIGTGASSVVTQLNAELDHLRRAKSIEFNRRARQLDNLAVPDGGGTFNPSSVRLPVHYERVRVLAADASENYLTARLAVSDYSSTTFQEVERIVRGIDELDPNDPRRSQLILRQFNLRLDAQRMRAWTGLELDALERELVMLREQLPPSFTEQLTPLQAWAELHRGDPTRAMRLTDGLQISEMSTYQLILRGAAMETLRRNDEAVELFRAAHLQAADGFERLWAAARARRLDPEVDLSGPYKAQVDRLARSVPGWIDRMASDPTSFLEMSVTALKSQIEPGESVRLRVVIRNLAPVPLGMGTNHPINTSAVVVPAFDRGRTLLSGQPRMEVTDLSHRLRLERSEVYETIISADAGETGWLFDLHPLQRIAHRWRVVQGFVLDTNARVMPGPGSLAVESGVIERQPLTETSEQILPLDQVIPVAEGKDLVMALLRSRAIVLRASASDVSSGIDHDELAALWVQRFERETDLVAKSAMVVGLPHGLQSGPFGAFDERVRDDATRALNLLSGSAPAESAESAGSAGSDGSSAAVEQIPAYVASVLLTRPGALDGVFMERAALSSDARLNELAEAIAARGRAGGGGYAQATDGWASVVGSSLRFLEVRE